MRTTVKRSDLFTKHGFPIMGLRYLMDRHNLSSLEDVERAVNQGELNQYDVFRVRGNGEANNPGRLARYLFSLESRVERKKREIEEKTLLDLGSGI